MPAGYVYDAAGKVLKDGLKEHMCSDEARGCAVRSPSSAWTGNGVGLRVVTWVTSCPGWKSEISLKQAGGYCC